MYAKINLLFALLLAAFAGYGQDMKSDLQRIVQSTDSASSVALEASVKVYQRRGGKLTYSTTAASYRSGATRLTILGEQEYFVSEEYDVTVDHEEKAVLILKKTAAKSKKQKAQQLDVDVSGILKLLEKEEQAAAYKTTVSGGASGKRTYTMTGIPGYKEITATLDMNTLSIERITYEMSDAGESKGQLIMIEYTRFKKGGDVAARLASSNFFTVAGKSYKLAPRLATYHLYTEL